MQGFYAIFRVRAFRAGRNGPEEVIRTVTVWVEASLTVEAGTAPVELAALQTSEHLVLSAISAEDVAALVDDLDVEM